jgi:AraC-like DNA-binding protein
MAESRCDLNPAEGSRRFHQSGAEPSDPALTTSVDAYWMVDWHLPAAEPYVHESLPDPAMHLVLQAGQSRLAGVCTSRFTHTLKGTGRIFGARFRPAGFHAYAQVAASSCTDRVIPVEQLFGAAGTGVEREVLATDPRDDAAAVAVVEEFLRSVARDPHRHVDLVQRVFNSISADRSIRRVEHLVERFHVSARTLQRLFATCIGVSPTWVIRRQRLIEAADRVIDGSADDWAGLAADLGYFDQAHLVNDFRTVVGRPPGAHARLVRA